MRLLIVVPEECPIDGYTAIPALDDVRYSRLVRYEDKLKKLAAAVAKLLTETLAKPQKLEAGELGMGRVVSEFSWDCLIRSGASIEGILEGLDSAYSELKDARRRMADEAKEETVRCNRQLNAELGAFSGQNAAGLEGEFEFIECAYATVAQDAEREFTNDLKQILGPEYALRLSSTSGHCIYKVYYLKKDSEFILGRIGKKYPCERAQIAKARRQSTPKESTAAEGHAPLLALPTGRHADAVRKSCEKDACGRVAGRQAHIALECARLYMRVCAFAGYVESLHRYGMPGRYKYKISGTSASGQKRELKKVKESLISAGIIEISSDDEECSFTQVQLQEFQEE